MSKRIDKNNIVYLVTAAIGFLSFFLPWFEGNSPLTILIRSFHNSIEHWLVPLTFLIVPFGFLTCILIRTEFLRNRNRTKSLVAELTPLLTSVIYYIFTDNNNRTSIWKSDLLIDSFGLLIAIAAGLLLLFTRESIRSISRVEIIFILLSFIGLISFFLPWAATSTGNSISLYAIFILNLFTQPIFGFLIIIPLLFLWFVLRGMGKMKSPIPIVHRALHFLPISIIFFTNSLLFTPTKFDLNEFFEFYFYPSSFKFGFYALLIIALIFLFAPNVKSTPKNELLMN